MSEDARVRAGQALYSLPGLRLWYDLVVFGVNNHLVWRCPTRELRTLYRRHLSSDHLEAGVGSGYLLDRCGFPTDEPRLVLVDLNASALAVTARRVARYRPRTLRRNLLEPLAWDGEPFDSVGLNYVLHCLPGTMAEKAVVFDHLGALLRPGGVIFGSSLLASGVRRGALARMGMDLYNGMGVLSNAADSLDALRGALRSRFRDVEIRAVGCVALFSARAP